MTMQTICYTPRGHITITTYGSTSIITPRFDGERIRGNYATVAGAKGAITRAYKAWKRERAADTGRHYAMIAQRYG